MKAVMIHLRRAKSYISWTRKWIRRKPTQLDLRQGIAFLQDAHEEINRARNILVQIADG